FKQQHLEFQPEKQLINKYTTLNHIIQGTLKGIKYLPKNTQDANWVVKKGMYMIQDSSQEWKRAIPGMIQDSSQEWKRAIYLQVTINKYTTLELFSLDKLIINLACIAVKMIQDSSQEWKRNAAYLGIEEEYRTMTELRTHILSLLRILFSFQILIMRGTHNAAYLVIWTPQICMFKGIFQIYISFVLIVLKIINFNQI
ncbi:hypothetical protein ACJX0J_024160, partial [Zea mays]